MANSSTENRSTLDSPILFDLTGRTVIEAAGPDAATFLHNLCTQDIKTLPVGETREAFLTTNKARVVAHVWITHRATNLFWLETVARQAEKILEHLNRFLISEQVELTDRTLEVGVLRVIGAGAGSLAGSHGRSHQLSGVEGVDCFYPIKEAATLRQSLVAAGATLGDAAWYNVLRIEAGLPEYGIDIDENRLAMEVNRPQAISYNKGCYLGQETIVMARDRGHVNRMLTPLRIDGDQPATPGARVFHQEQEVGQVTSAAVSPRLGAIALAYLRRGFWEPGMQLFLDHPGGPIAHISGSRTETSTK